jgi:uncharacterized RDD family membrane protein YckC
VSVAPGWYQDPAEPYTQRWWDGEGWVGDPLPAHITPPPGPPPPSRTARPSDEVPPATPAPPTGAVPPPEPTPPPAEVPPGWPVRHTQPQVAVQVPSRPHGHQLATLGARIVARLVDIGIVFLLNAIVNGWFVYRYWLEVSPLFQELWDRFQAGDDNTSDLPAVGDQATNLQIVIVILAAALWFAYEVPAVANTGQTPGKRLLGIKVVRLEQAGPVGFGRSLRRWNTIGIPTLLWFCCGIGLLLQIVDVVFALGDRRLQQALHDRSAHTVVISVETSGQPRETPDDQQADTS